MPYLACSLTDFHTVAVTDGAKCLSNSFKNTLPILVRTLLLNGGLNQIEIYAYIFGEAGQLDATDLKRRRTA